MKVRLFTLAAAAAIALPTEGVAQQSGDSLERALADLNAGLVSPAQDTGGSNWAPIFSGSFRARNLWFDDGNETNNLDIDAGVKLHMLWNVTESSRLKVGMAASEAFGDGTSSFNTWPPLGSGTQTPGTFDDGNGGFDINIVKAEVDSLLGLGGVAGIGRDNYTLGSGRLWGADPWRDYELTNSGIWYDNQILDNVGLHISMINGTENGWTGVGAVQDVSDDYIFTYAVPLTFNFGESGGDIEFLPYFIRANVPGTTHRDWMGLQVIGELLGFSYDVEFADSNFGDFGGSAFAIDLSYTLNALTSIPFIESGEINFLISDADAEFGVLNPTFHDTAGFSDLLGEGGLWTPGASVWGLGIGIQPAEGWDGRLDFYSVDATDVSFGSRLSGDEWTEIDLSVGVDLNGGVESWFGVAFVSPDMYDSHMVFWAVLELAFGGEDEAGDEAGY